MDRSNAHGRHVDDERLQAPSSLAREERRLGVRRLGDVDPRSRLPDDVALRSDAATNAALGERSDLRRQLAIAQNQCRRQAAELEQARELLLSERERFRDLFEIAPEGHVVTDPTGTIREANRAAAAMLNIPIDYLIGKPLAVFIASAERRAFRVRVYRARADSAEEAWTVSLQPREGEPVQALVAASPLLDARGTVTGIRWLVRDVSKRRAGIVVDRTPAAVLRSAIDALSTHVVVILADGAIVTVNRAWRDATLPGGLFDAGLPGSNYFELCERALTAGRAGAEVVRSAVLRVLGGDVSRADALYSDGLVNAGSAADADSDRWFALRVTRCDGPEPTMLVVTHDDVTVERRAQARETALSSERTARAAAEAASNAKSEFLTTLSHELRTPLNAIGGYAQLLEMGVRGPVTQDQAEDLRRILRSERHLLGLINELLNFARVERRDVAVVVSRIGVTESLREVVELIAPQAAAKSIEITVQCDDDELAVSGDGEKLRQILLNLLTNAVKFTPSGGSVRLVCSADDDRVVIAVRDTGIGIPQSKLSVVFDPFVQVHRGTGSSPEGIGLGLAISRELARAMGGDITVESAPGSGSVFALSLPRASVSAAVS